MTQKADKHPFEIHRFPHLEKLLKSFGQADFRKLREDQRSERVNRALLELIQKEPEPAFLLPAVMEYIYLVEQEGVLPHYAFPVFELWLNQSSGLTFDENYLVRAKIAGKRVERSDYQGFFPIGTGKIYEGTHFVSAHKSPDLDTTIASFWGWLDAFAARVGSGLHIWSLPGGPPAGQIEIQWLFMDLIHPAVFTHLAKNRTMLTLTSQDLVTQQSLVYRKLSDAIASVDPERGQQAVVVVDGEGIYQGDWHSFDVEGVRQVIMLLSSCLRWFENRVQLQLISHFAKEELSLADIGQAMEGLFSMKLQECEPGQEFTSKQANEVRAFLVAVLGLESGLDATFDELRHCLRVKKLGSFPSHSEWIEGLRSAGLFDKGGALREDRPGLFRYLEKALEKLHAEIQAVRRHLDTMQIALQTKRGVFRRQPTFITVGADLEEIRAKMESYSHLTVVHPDHGGLFPVGVVRAADVRRPILGTVSLRDFCNREEMGIPPYLEVISVIDHHRSTLATSSPPLAIISDVQSSNTLVARQAFKINDRYSRGEKDHKAIGEQLAKGHTRIAMRLLQRNEAQGAPYYIHPAREFLEYLHFLYGILDDTDLLSKVTVLDLECVTSLLNRLESLAAGREMELISLDDLPRDRSFCKKAADRLLRNKELYSLYRKVYLHREKEMLETLRLCADGKPSIFFADTKVQNGCCRVGQTKLFAANIALFEEKANGCRHAWLHAAKEAHREKSEIDLHIHMISTVVHAEEVYAGKVGNYSHKDEMWLWIPPNQEIAIEHLKRFLIEFQSSPGLKENPVEVLFTGSNAEELALIFQETFPKATQRRAKRVDESLPIAVLFYNAGSLNSRKAMVTPFLPKAE